MTNTREPVTSTQPENTDSGLVTSQDTDTYSDSVFEVLSPSSGKKTDDLQHSLSSLSSVSSLPLGDEAGNHIARILDVPIFNALRRKTKGRKKIKPAPSHNELNRNKAQQKSSSQELPSVSGAVPNSATGANNRKTCAAETTLRRNRKSSVNSVALLAKYKAKQDRKAAFTITLLITLFAVFKVPYALALLSNAFQGSYWVSLNVYETVTWLCWIKSVTNPFVYAFISKTFRVYCHKLFKRIKRRLFPNRFQ